MTIPSKSLLSLLARLLALLLCLCCDTYHLLYHASYIALSAPNHPCPSKPLFGYVTALLSPSYSVVVAGEDEVCSLLEHGLVVPCWNMFTCWDITIPLI